MTSVHIVLLRAIGPITHAIMSMSRWRSAVETAGFGNVQTYLATGNMMMTGNGTAAEITKQMNAVVRRLGLAESTVAVVRSPAQLARLVKANPFPDAAENRPSQMGVYFFAKARPDFGWIADYDGPEQLHVEGQHLIVDYTHQISASPRLPGLIEKRSGTCTARNWNTLRGLAERGAALEKGS